MILWACDVMNMHGGVLLTEMLVAGSKLRAHYIAKSTQSHDRGIIELVALVA